MFDVSMHEELKDVFDYFDTDRDGSICPRDLKNALKDHHNDVTNDELNHMILYLMSQVDMDEDGLINFQEFVTIMETL